MIAIFLSCHKCGARIEANGDPTLNGWLSPYHVRTGEHSWLQTQLCPNCAGWSFRQWLKTGGRRWRWLNKIYADFRGYFWLPCPLCGRYFGGHEMSGSLYLGMGRGQGTCFDCRDKAELLSEQNSEIEILSRQSSNRGD